MQECVPSKVDKKYRERVIATLKYATFIKESGQWNYHLTHTYDNDQNRKEYVSSPYSYDTMYALIAYIQYETAEHDESYSMDQNEIIETLEKFYECKRSEVPLKFSVEIDLYINWEEFCGVAEEVQNINVFHRAELREHLKTYVDAYHKTMMGD